MKIAGFVEERGRHGVPIQFTGSPGIYQYHKENIPVINEVRPVSDSPSPAKTIKN